jgi:hypothetical protein
MGGRRRVGQPADWMWPAKAVGSSDRQIRLSINPESPWGAPREWSEVTDPKLPRKASRENQGARTANRRW